MSTEDARIERLYALAERLGRISGEAHNLVNDLTAKIAARRATMRSTSLNLIKRGRRRSRPKKS